MGEASDRLVKTLDVLANAIDHERAESERVALFLAEAMGPDLTAAAGPALAFVVDFRSAGLTFADIEADAPSLAETIRRLHERGWTRG